MKNYEKTTNLLLYFLTQYYAAKMLIGILEHFFRLFTAVKKMLISSLVLKNELYNDILRRHKINIISLVISYYLNSSNPGLHFSYLHGFQALRVRTIQYISLVSL